MIARLSSKCDHFLKLKLWRSNRFPAFLSLERQLHVSRNPHIYVLHAILRYNQPEFPTSPCHPNSYFSLFLLLKIERAVPLGMSRGRKNNQWWWSEYLNDTRYCWVVPVDRVKVWLRPVNHDIKSHDWNTDHSSLAKRIKYVSLLSRLQNRYLILFQCVSSITRQNKQ